MEVMEVMEVSANKRALPLTSITISPPSLLTSITISLPSPPSLPNQEQPVSQNSIVHFLSQAPPERRAEAKRKMAEFARARSEYHQQRAEYWYRIQTECDQEACDIEDATA